MNEKQRRAYLNRLDALRGRYQPEDFSRKLYVNERRICIASDVHLPYHDTALIAEMFARCEHEKIEAIVWLGDLLDLPTLSSWGVTDKQTTLVDQLREVRGLVEMAAEVVPVQYWSRGNHEERWMRKLEHQAGMEQLAQMAGLGSYLEDDILVLSDNPTLLADSGLWMLTHPASYGATPLVVPSKLATRYGRNVLSAHAHHFGMTTDESGNFLAVETGGLFDPRLHQYVQWRITTHRAWQQGYWLLMDGTPIGYRNRSALTHASVGVEELAA
jgi:UDP-2,3-diacylglucosamine pyrophosphatase LpxH